MLPHKIFFLVILLGQAAQVQAVHETIIRQNILNPQSSTLTIEFALLLGGNPNHTYEDCTRHWQPLHYLAAARGNSNKRAQCIFNLLKQKGADLNGQDVVQWTPLHIALAQKNEVIALALIEAPNIRLGVATKNEQWTSLHIAAQSCLVNMTKQILVKYGQMDQHLIDQADASGLSALHYAVFCETSNVMKILLQFGANPKAQTHQDILFMDFPIHAHSTPIDIAYARKDRAKLNLFNRSIQKKTAIIKEKRPVPSKMRRRSLGESPLPFFKKSSLSLHNRFKSKDNSSEPKQKKGN